MIKKAIISILIIIFSLINISPVIAISAAKVDDFSTCEEDIKAFGIDESNLILQNGQNQQVNVLLFAETKNEDGKYFYYLYLHDANGFTEFDAKYYQSLQFGYLTALSEDLLADDNKIARSSNYKTITYLSSSSSGTVAKYLLDFSAQNMKTFRRYQLRQIEMQKNGERSFLQIGDEYFYKTNDDGTVDYKYKKMDYITFEDIKLSSYLVNTNEETYEYLIESLIGVVECNKYEFYGFSLPNGFNVDNIKSIRFNYIEYDYEFNKPGTDIYAPIFQYDPGIGFGDMYGYSDYDIKLTNPIRNSNIVTNYTIEEDVRSHWYISQKFKWKTISTYKDLEKIDNNSFRTGLQTDFKECDYIINFAASNVRRYDKQFVYAKGSSLSEYDPFIYFLKNYDENVSSIYNRTWYVYSNYISTYYGDVEPVYFTFERDGIIYDINVIVSPKDSPLESNGVKPDKDIIDIIIDLYKKFVAWIMETFGVSEPLAHIIAIGAIIAATTVVTSLLGGFISDGLSKGITKVVKIIFSIITWPIRLLFLKDKDLIMKKGE